LRKVLNNGQFAYEYIREAICKWYLKPGSPITEKWIGENLHMSRTPVREALIRLQSDGLITVTNSRATVTSVSLADINDIFQLRLVLEPYAAAICIKKIDKERILEMRKSTEILLPQNKQTFDEDIHDLHRLIIDSTENKRLISFMKTLDYQIMRLLHVSAYIPGRVTRSLEEHLPIIDAILADDAVMAQKHMRIHVESNMKDALESANFHFLFKG
jgi:DNA-binding GntR family transcriptional regulator